MNSDPSMLGKMLGKLGFVAFLLLMVTINIFYIIFLRKRADKIKPINSEIERDFRNVLRNIGRLRPYIGISSQDVTCHFQSMIDKYSIEGLHKFFKINHGLHPGRGGGKPQDIVGFGWKKLIEYSFNFYQCDDIYIGFYFSEDSITPNKFYAYLAVSTL